MIKLFVTGDNHIGKRYDRYPQAKEKLIKSRIDSIEGMVREAEYEKCDLFIVTGDLFDRINSIKVGDVKRVVDILSSFDGCVLVLPGNHVYENGGRSEVKRICEWKSDYECFAVRLDSVEKAFIYIKCSDRLIRIVLDEELNERISLRTELQIQGDLETIRELRVINETTLAAIGKNELYILSIEKNKDVEEVKCKKLKTDIIIRNSLLEDEDGSNRVRDAKAYELLCASMC